MWIADKNYHKYTRYRDKPVSLVDNGTYIEYKSVILHFVSIVL